MALFTGLLSLPGLPGGLGAVGATPSSAQEPNGGRGSNLPPRTWSLGALGWQLALSHSCPCRLGRGHQLCLFPTLLPIFPACPWEPMARPPACSGVWALQWQPWRGRHRGPGSSLQGECEPQHAGRVTSLHCDPPPGRPLSLPLQSASQASALFWDANIHTLLEPQIKGCVPPPASQWPLCAREFGTRGRGRGWEGGLSTKILVTLRSQQARMLREIPGGGLSPGILLPEKGARLTSRPTALAGGDSSWGKSPLNPRCVFWGVL